MFEVIVLIICDFFKMLWKRLFRNSKWWDGFLWAESMRKIHGKKKWESIVKNQVEEAIAFSTYDDFDRGAEDYIKYWSNKNDV